MKADLDFDCPKAGFNRFLCFSRGFVRLTCRHHIADRDFLDCFTAQELIDRNAQFLTHDVVKGIIDNGLGLVIKESTEYPSALLGG